MTVDALSAQRIRALAEHHRRLGEEPGATCGVWTCFLGDEVVVDHRPHHRALAESLTTGLDPTRPRRFRARVLVEVRCDNRERHEVALAYATTVAPVLVHRIASRSYADGTELRRRVEGRSAPAERDPWFIESAAGPVFRTALLDADALARRHTFTCHCGLFALDGAELAAAVAKGARRVPVVVAHPAT